LVTTTFVYLAAVAAPLLFSMTSCAALAATKPSTIASTSGTQVFQFMTGLSVIGPSAVATTVGARLSPVRKFGWMVCAV
jgi:hypothetical protein